MTSWRRSAPRWSAAIRISSATPAASPGWEALKAAERGADPDASALAGVALALPALKRAEKIQRRAARIGFDWPDAEGPRRKIDEELGEIERAGDRRGARRRDRRPAVRRRQLCPPPRRRTPKRRCASATARFEARFRKVEELADKPLKDMNIDELEALWQRAKKLV